jgi:hypothetical protein
MAQPKYVVLLEIFGKKMRITIPADSRHNAIEAAKDRVRDKVVIIQADKVKPPRDDDDGIDFLKGIFGMS